MLIVVRYYCLSSLNADKVLSKTRSAKASASLDVGDAGDAGVGLDVAAALAAYGDMANVWPGASAVSDCLAGRSTSSLFSITGSNRCELVRSRHDTTHKRLTKRN